MTMKTEKRREDTEREEKQFKLLEAKSVGENVDDWWSEQWTTKLTLKADLAKWKSQSWNAIVIDFMYKLLL